MDFRIAQMQFGPWTVEVIHCVTDELRAARLEAKAMAFDAEWPPERAGSAPSTATVLQLAFRPSGLYKAFIVGILSLGDSFAFVGSCLW